MFLNTRSLFIWCLATLVEVEAASLPSKSKPITVSQCATSDAGIPLDSFMSFSFELSSWPDFAGNLTNPNKYSYNLMNNIGQLQGSMPIARVGGNTQDIAIFDASQKTGLVGVVRPNISADYPTIITIGPSFFDSYKTMPKGVRFTHGFNLGANSSAARSATFASAAYACKAIGSNLLYFEYGNEPDLFWASGYRPRNYTEADYVEEWLNGTSQISAAVKSACPSLAGTKYMAPSFAGVANNSYFTLDPVRAFKEDLNAAGNIGLISSHNYMGVSTNPGITLQGTLMNHSNVIAKAEDQLQVSRNITALGGDLAPKVPFILGEHNSLARQGRPGLSNTFGAALWGVDWNVYLASQNISRSHMHQGTNYRYQAWQPITTNLTTIGTKPPYYGNLAVAAMMSKPCATSNLAITHLAAASSDNNSFYTAHVDNKLARILIIDLHTYNTTANNFTTEFPRPVQTHEFVLPKGCKTGTVARLIANGSDALTGITFDGKSYAYELDMGKGVKMANVTQGECVSVDRKGGFKVDVPWSSAAIVSLKC